ncbi:WD40/YVTN/BNR-like repeat-containing protein, partial [Chitinimonas sp.]|uniref:WD40/YVTN/BNR-like repeat-containing protein n=1 Tax=Chitinimonas sp. TaxID=1934313 RepID=UPI0035B40237
MPSFFARWILLPLLALLVITSAAMADDAWTRGVGIDGATLTALVKDRSGNLYAATTDGGVYKSSNGGDSWATVNNGLSKFGDNPWINSLLADRAGNLYLARYDGVYRSSNGGDSWTVAKRGLANPA